MYLLVAHQQNSHTGHLGNSTAGKVLRQTSSVFYHIFNKHFRAQSMPDSSLCTGNTIVTSPYILIEGRWIHTCVCMCMQFYTSVLSLCLYPLSSSKASITRLGAKSILNFKCPLPFLCTAEIVYCNLRKKKVK